VRCLLARAKAEPITYSSILVDQTVLMKMATAAFRVTYTSNPYHLRIIIHYPITIDLEHSQLTIECRQNTMYSILDHYKR
jgi:uncharacterized membrane protein